MRALLPLPREMNLTRVGQIEMGAFAFISSQIKVKAGGASTFLQYVVLPVDTGSGASPCSSRVAQVRFGRAGHVSFATAALVANFGRTSH